MSLMYETTADIFNINIIDEQLMIQRIVYRDHVEVLLQGQPSDNPEHQSAILRPTSKQKKASTVSDSRDNKRRGFSLTFGVLSRHELLLVLTPVYSPCGEQSGRE